MKPVNPPEQCLFLRQSYTLGLCTPSQTRHWQTILMLLRFKQLGAMGFRLVCCKVLVSDLRTGLPSVLVPYNFVPHVPYLSLDLIKQNKLLFVFYCEPGWSYEVIFSTRQHRRLATRCNVGWARRPGVAGIS